MDIKVLKECKSLSLAGKITFPEVVMKLAAARTERYIVDLVGLKSFYFGANNESYIDSSEFKVPKVSSIFEAAAVKEAINDIQHQRIDYQTFLNRISKAGCSHYEVFIKGRKAIYFGRDGSQHIENFPKAKQ